MLGRSEWQDARALAFRARLNDYKKWLAEQGAVVQPNTSNYEMLRYRARSERGAKLKSHVVYRKADGRITFTGEAAHHWQLFASKSPFPDQAEGEAATNPKTVKKRKKSPAKKSPNIPGVEPGDSWTKRTRAILRHRDGDMCWYCGQTMFDIPHPTLPGTTFNDVTIEHMVAKHLAVEQGWTPAAVNHIDNLTLAHAKCNRDVGHKTLEEKMAVRDYIRAGLTSKVEHWAPPEISPPPRNRKKSKGK